MTSRWQYFCYNVMRQRHLFPVGQRLVVDSIDRFMDINYKNIYLLVKY